MKPGTVVPGFLDGGHWSACFGLSYLELTLYDLGHNQRIIRKGGLYLRKCAGTAGVPDGRNEVAARFLDDTDAEWLFFIDTDMGFAPDTVDRLVESADPVERPVMGGLCFAQRRIEARPFHGNRFGIIPTVYDYVETADEVGFAPREDYAPDQVIEVSGTGAACLLIHRSALERIRDVHGDVWFDPLKHPTGLKGKPRTFSEDLSFCVRLAMVGVPLHVDTRVKTVHEKGGIFLDEDAYNRQQMMARVADDAEPAVPDPVGAR